MDKMTQGVVNSVWVNIMLILAKSISTKLPLRTRGYLGRIVLGMTHAYAHEYMIQPNAYAPVLYRSARELRTYANSSTEGPYRIH